MVTDSLYRRPIQSPAAPIDLDAGIASPSRGHAATAGAAYHPIALQKANEPLSRPRTLFSVE